MSSYDIFNGTKRFFKCNVSGNGIINYSQIIDRFSARALNILFFRHSEKISNFWVIFFFYDF